MLVLVVFHGTFGLLSWVDVTLVFKFFSVGRVDLRILADEPVVRSAYMKKYSLVMIIILQWEEQQIAF